MTEQVAATEIYLVHGTFSDGHEWIGEESPFSRELSDLAAGPTTVKRFGWSGANSHSARLTAGAALAEELEASRRATPAVKQFVVGHSHGGNVALYASRIVQGLGGCVCLATPFIEARIRRVAGVYKLILLAVMLAAAAAANVATDTHIPEHFGVFGVIIVISIPLIAIRLYFVFARMIDAGMSDRDHRLSIRARELDTSGPTLNRVLVLGHRADEARAWLRLSSKVGGLLFKFGTLWTRLIGLTRNGDAVKSYVFLLAIVLIPGQLWARLEGFEMVSYFMWTAGPLILVPSLLATITIFVYLVGTPTALLLRMLTRSHSAAFGTESLSDALGLDLYARKHPRGAEVLWLPVKGLAFRHSAIHQDQRAAVLAAKWINQQVTLQEEAAARRAPALGPAASPGVPGGVIK